jgi:hypothetical protein
MSLVTKGAHIEPTLMHRCKIVGKHFRFEVRSRKLSIWFFFETQISHRPTRSESPIARNLSYTPRGQPEETHADILEQEKPSADTRSSSLFFQGGSMSEPESMDCGTFLTTAANPMRQNRRFSRQKGILRRYLVGLTVRTAFSKKDVGTSEEFLGSRSGRVIKCKPFGVSRVLGVA